MAFGYRLRSQQGSRTHVDEPRTQHHPSATTSSSRHHSSASSNQDALAPRQPLHRIRLDGNSNSSGPPPPPAPQSQNNYLQQRLERAVLNGATSSSATGSATTGSSSSTSSAHGARRRDRELARSVLETTSAGAASPAHTFAQSPHVRPTRTMTTVSVPTTAASSFLDERAQALELPRRRRGTTSVYSSARSTTSSSSAGRSESHDHRAPEPRVDVLLKGHLLLKRGLLKGLEKRFYFVTRGAPELYCCKDETSFNLWHASGWGLDATSAVPKSSGLAPLLVCSVLRADRAGDSGGNDRGLVLVAAPAPGASAVKPTTLKFYAESAEKCERWLHALHRVQVTKRASAAGEPQDPQSPLSSTAASSSNGSSKSKNQNQNQNQDQDRTQNNGPDFVASPRLHSHIHSRQASRSDASQTSSAASTTTTGPRAYAGGHLRATSRDETNSVKSSESSSDAASDATAGGSGRAPALFHSTLSATSSQGNVLLFVPAAGSAISVSDAKLALARKQMDELLASGAKRPTRSGMDSATSEPSAMTTATTTAISWRYGAPDYVLADVEYMKHKQREHESTPLESYVEACCQTFVMEATHKARYSEWASVQHDAFYLQVNDGARIAGHAIGEHDMFGLLFVNDCDGADVDTKEGDAKDPRAMLAEAFTEGFPMEVLEVFTQPPQCYFSWRHWGPFTGLYKGVKGDGSRVEIRGFGQMHIDSHRMRSLRLFVKTKDLFDGLNRVSAALGAKARDVQRARAVSSAVPPSVAAAAGRSTAATPAAAAPAKSKATLTADIMDELANFTIASSTAATRNK